MDTENVVVTIRDRLLKEREALLDLSTRNRLLNTPLRTRNNRAIEIVDEKSEEVFRILTSGKAMTFLPGVQSSEEGQVPIDLEDIATGGIPQPEDDDVDENGILRRHTDNRLQTRLTSEGLQKRLFDIWYDAQTLEQEQGVNILYLAIGLLRWFDSNSSEVARHAPLVLLPVKLERTSASERFKLRWRDEPPSPNLTLQAKMKAEFGIAIKDFEDEDEVDLGAYSTSIASSLASKERWEVQPDSMVLGFFSFSKFLMYRDLDPDNWPEESQIDQHPMIAALLRDGFPVSEPLVPDDATIDEIIPPLDLHHVVDADSSQTVAIAEAAGGRTLVVKGPPGTGKSQTITNIIAAATARGKKVLFVAEKMAALDVVHRRLQQVGLGPLTLELHSNKVSKRSVLEELKRTRDAHPKAPRDNLTVVQKLGESTASLNSYAARLHTPLSPSGLSPYQILGMLVRTERGEFRQIYALSDAETWTRVQYEERRELVRELCERLAFLGPVPNHKWRGVRREALDPTERIQLADRIVKVRTALENAVDRAQMATANLLAPTANTLEDFKISKTFLDITASPTGLDRAALSHPAWTSDVKGLAQLVELGAELGRMNAKVNDVFNAAGQVADLSSIRLAVAIKGGHFFRFLDSNYRAQIALLRSYMRSSLPKHQTERLSLIDDMIAAQSMRQKFGETEVLGQAFGIAWDGTTSDWNTLWTIISWRQSHSEVPAETWALLARHADPDALLQALDIMGQALQDLDREFAALLSDLDLDLKRAFGVSQSKDIPNTALMQRLDAWLEDLEGITRFIAFSSRGRALAVLGVSSLVEAVHDGQLDHNTLLPVFEAAYADVMRTVLFSDWPALKGFDGDTQNKIVEQFRLLDRTCIELAKEKVARIHAESRPNGAAGIGPLGVLNAEMAKKRRHLPIRVLLEKAGPAIQQLKPVFMMSPLSVAQFLKPGGLTFDLMIMDEASQIEPVDALGAITRANQIVVVGDERQLPPTAFFRKLTGDSSDEDDEGITIQAKDAESILELCLAKGVPYRMLSWHYRSKHQSLIAVSNREFYESKLYIVPSPYDAVAGMGLKFNLLKNAPYDRGGTRTNPTEARIIAEAVIRQARMHPDQSLGVATFSVAQRQMILKELELLRRANPGVEGFFSPETAEPFFVKNLENIQGDERDVIFISVGYGKTEEGYLAHSFGPLSSEGGERRLNVLISRAKLRCEVFCNFTGSDVDMDRTRSRGVAALKLFLTFAETGNFGLGEVSGEDYDSEFERQVCDRLRALGYDVKSQIGASGFRVDLAVADSERPGRFTLGIECDGAQYHSSRSARDRDRLRQQVLEAHGWIIHRIWSADWYLRPQEELKKMEAAIAAAKAEWRERDDGIFQPRQAVPIEFEGESSDHGEFVTAIVGDQTSADTGYDPYVEAQFRVNRSVEPHEASLADMAGYVVKIVETEGPVHIDEITARVRSLWGLARAGSRIRSAVDLAARVAARHGLIEGRPFYSIPGKVVTVRDRARVTSPTLRKPEMLPPMEVDKAILVIIDENFGAARAELTQAVSRAFGFAATSTQLREVIEARINALITKGLLEVKDDLLVRSKEEGA